MPITPAQAHRQRKLAALATQTAKTEFEAAERIIDSPEDLSYRMLLQTLGEHIRKIEGIQSREEKIAYKRQIMPEFIAHIDGLMNGMRENGAAVQDEIFAYYMVWCFDIFDFQTGLEMAELAIRFNIKLPSRFKTELPVFLIETMTRLADDALVLNEQFDISLLKKLLLITTHSSIADQKRAKLHKSIGLTYYADSKAKKPIIAAAQKAGEPIDEELTKAEDFAAFCAFEHLMAAQKLNPDFGAKSELRTLAKRFNAPTPE